MISCAVADQWIGEEHASCATTRPVCSAGVDPALPANLRKKVLNSCGCGWVRSPRTQPMRRRPHAQTSATCDCLASFSRPPTANTPASRMRDGSVAYDDCALLSPNCKPSGSSAPLMSPEAILTAPLHDEPAYFLSLRSDRNAGCHRRDQRAGAPRLICPAQPAVSSRWIPKCPRRYSPPGPLLSGDRQPQWRLRLCYLGRMASAVPWMKALIFSRSPAFNLPVKSGMPPCTCGPLNTN